MSDQSLIFYEVAQTVLDCVCSAMSDLQETDDSYIGCPCSGWVSWGEPSIDCCSSSCDGPQGMLTVHTDSVFPSDTFPNSATTFEPCKASAWVASVIVTVARCAPSVDSRGKPPSPEALSANALLMARDEWAILTALGCCVVQDTTGLGKRKRRVLVTGATPLVSDGGCSVLEVRAFVEAGNVCSCPSEGS